MRTGFSVPPGPVFVPVRVDDPASVPVALEAHDGRGGVGVEPRRAGAHEVLTTVGRHDGRDGLAVLLIGGVIVDGHL